MGETTIIGVDLAKRTFQLHGAAADGSVVFRKKVSRDQLLEFLARQPQCVVAMEACASAHHWGREIMELGHEVRLIPPIYVKPYVKRQKNDAADAEAIAEAASRPTMRFVAVKSAEQQGSGMLFRTRDLWVRQRTQTINALRGHLAEFGIVAPAGHARTERLAQAVEDDASALPETVRTLARMLLEQIGALTERIDALEKEIRRRAPKDPELARLMTIPGVGAICATAVKAFCPSMSQFRSGRDFAAWVGLTPRQNSTGGKTRLGRTSKMGQRDVRRLLIIGASAVVCWAARKGARPGSWLARMMARKPHMLVVVALANKMARTIWALSTRQEEYRDPAMVA
ncbi:IS110 family transposase [Minwuia thermotolerans]|uniref:IS110 family transposase n=1 Tax=Minwuia thermotolerans TaxID=2056226 RepID=A0A2M9G4L9_9PROT|nr:IS110 family transposase [Minwuia thermotolerans]PJK30665.1 IS110 family transposase [Minwuia thermotolerans]